MTALISTPTRRRAQFHELEVVDVQRLTPNAVAVTFAVPDELADDFTFAPGQHLTLRRTINGEDARRSYSICMSRPEALRRKVIRVGSAEVDGGLMSTWLNREVKVGDRIDAGIQCQLYVGIAGQAVAGQVDDMQGAAIAQAFDQGREHAAVHRPAMQQDHIRSVAEWFDVQTHAPCSDRIACTSRGSSARGREAIQANSTMPTMIIAYTRNAGILCLIMLPTPRS